MATIAELELPADEFVLTETLDTVEDVSFKIKRIIAHDPEGIMPLVYATTTDVDILKDNLEEDPTVTEVDQLAETDDNLLYQMHWIEAIDALVYALIEEEGTILAAEGDQNGWLLRMLFPDRDSLSRTYCLYQENDLSFDVQTVYDVSDEPRDLMGLTETQEEVIRMAYERGFYDVPRGITLSDLAEEFDISHQALSERIRRGHKTLVENSLLAGCGDEKEEE